jgi:hypothetical protein
MAGDRRMSWADGQVQVMPKPKIIKIGHMLLGGTGSCYLLNLMTTLLDIPELPAKEDTHVYMYHSFKQQIHKLLIQQGLTDRDRHLILPSDLSLELVVALNGHLFSVDIENPDQDSHKEYGLRGLISIDELAVPYGTGCGGQLAWGSLLTTADMELTPQERLKLALNAAAQVSSGCDQNIDIIHE